MKVSGVSTCASSEAKKSPIALAVAQARSEARAAGEKVGPAVSSAARIANGSKPAPAPLPVEIAPSGDSISATPVDFLA